MNLSLVNSFLKRGLLLCFEVSLENLVLALVEVLQEVAV